MSDKLITIPRYLSDYSTFLILGNGSDISESYAYKIFTKVSTSLVRIIKFPSVEDLDLQTIIVEVTEQEREKSKK